MSWFIVSDRDCHLRPTIGLVLLGAITGLCSAPAAPAQLFESPGEAIVVHCSETNVKLRVKVNNGPPQNPNVNYSVDMGLGVKSTSGTLREPSYEVTGDCVQAPLRLQLGPISVESCSDGTRGHDTAPRQVAYNSGVLVTLAELDITPEPLCPSASEVTIDIDYFFENDVPDGGDDDQKATYVLGIGGAPDCPLTLVDANEALQARAQATFLIECIAEPPQPAQGVGPAAGRVMDAYITSEIEPGLTRISFDMTDLPWHLIPAELVFFNLGRPDGEFMPVGEAPAEAAEFQQTHTFVPSEFLELFAGPQGLLYFVTNEDGEVLFSSDFGPAPRVLEQPQTQVVCEGQPVTLFVEATGEGPFNYFWERDGAFYAFGEPVIEIPAASEDDEGTYQVQVIGPGGSVFSEYARIFVQRPDELPPVIVEPQRVPERWLNPAFQWSRDVAPFNKVDDLIDDAGAGTYDILVNYRRKTSTADEVWLSNFGTVQVVSQYIPTIAVAGVEQADVLMLAQDDDVAFIEQQLETQYSLDVATEATKVAAGFYSPDTVADQFGLDGAGVNIAIVDSGVDDPGTSGVVTHSGLPAAAFFYDNLVGVPGVSVNPFDFNGHGTHVAGIALGRGTANCPPGVATGAGLIDVRPGGSSAAAIDVLNVLITNRISWNIGVVNMSLHWGTPTATTDGQDAISQHVNTLVNAGVVVVSAVGNYGPGNQGLTAPQAADAGITVANSQDQGTADRSDDTLRSSSSRGPRADDMDGVCLDEFKPELAAPGTLIRSAASGTADGSTVLTGTSMASPHVAGIAALMLQGQPTLVPGAVRQALLTTAETRGAPFDPACDPDWDNGWGHGLVDAHAAVAAALGSGGGGTPQPTNLKFENFSGFVYTSTSIETTTPPRVGVQTQIRALVKNDGSNTATNVDVEFKIDYISASSWGFYIVGTTTIPSIAPGASEWAQINWTPQHPDHQCLKAEIKYAPDTNPSDNNAQRNITVAQSPVYFRVENLIRPEPIQVQFVPAFEDPDAGWDVRLTPESAELAPGEFVIVEALPLPPEGAPDGEQMMIYVSSVVDDCILLGGVGVLATMEDCNDNGIDDWLDIESGFSQDEDGDGTPDECQSVTGDLNCDGVVNGFDIDPFVLALADPDGYAAAHPDCDRTLADINGDGAIDGFDIDPFVELLTGA